jgi:hypothetical protein
VKENCMGFWMQEQEPEGAAKRIETAKSKQ